MPIRGYVGAFLFTTLQPERRSVLAVITISEELLVNERQWSSNLVLAWTLWLIGAGIVMADLFIPSADDIGHVGLVFFLGGMAFNNREMVAGLHRREQAAFDLGRESVRSIR